MGNLRHLHQQRKCEILTVIIIVCLVGLGSLGTVTTVATDLNTH